jgi:hypothetical protein
LLSLHETALFKNRQKRLMTNIVENEYHERVSLLPALLSIENETSSSETEIKEGELVVNQILNEIISNAFDRITTKLFTEDCSRPMTNVVENEEHEISLITLESQIIENETSGEFF